MNYKNRGMFAETIINQTIKFYRLQQKAIIHKILLPIVFSGIYHQPNKQLQLKKGWIKQKSTTDYYGIYQGKFLAFEVKSINSLNFPLRNIKPHQWEYLNLIKLHQGWSFLLIYFAPVETFILLETQVLNQIKGKSLSFTKALAIGKALPILFPGIIDFLV